MPGSQRGESGGDGVWDMLQAGCQLTDPTGASGVTGYIWFSQEQDNSYVEYRGYVNGLTEGKHGFHTHEAGDVGTDCSGAGSHFNPDSKNHASPTISYLQRHRGAQGNIVADANGRANVRMLQVDGVSLKSGATDNIIGRAIVVHAGEDDLGLGTGADQTGSLASGNAGARVACCKIEAFDTNQLPTGAYCTLDSGVETGSGQPGACAADQGLCCGQAMQEDSNNDDSDGPDGDGDGDGRRGGGRGRGERFERATTFPFCQAETSSTIQIADQEIVAQWNSAVPTKVYDFRCMDAKQIAVTLAASLATAFFMN